MGLRYVYVLQWASAFAEEEIADIQQAIGDRSANWQTDVHARCVHLVTELMPSLSVLSPGMIVIWICSLTQAFMWYATILKGRPDHMIGMLLHVSVSFDICGIVISYRLLGVVGIQALANLAALYALALTFAEIG